MLEQTPAFAATYFLPVSLGTIYLAMRLGLKVKDFSQLYQKSEAAALGVAGQMILLPALAFIFGLEVGVLDGVVVAAPAVVYALWVYIAAFFVIVISRPSLGQSENTPAIKHGLNMSSIKYHFYKMLGKTLEYRTGCKL